MMDVNEPVYAHDCATCRSLGVYLDAAGDRYDLYWCPQGDDIPTVIARWGDDGPEYLSGMQFGYADRDDAGSALGEAYRRASACGLALGRGR